MRILSVFGTRPEAIKMAPVVQALARIPNVESLVCVTAQHRQMLDQVLDLFQIFPDEDLDLMRPNQSLASLTASVFTYIDPVFEKLKPDWVLIQGDTTTVMATALTAFYRRIRIGHVEAGLRTGDKWQPFPEEVNRHVAGVVTDLHFAPTEWAQQNLLKENIPARQIVVTGNTVIDALHLIAKLPTPADTLTLLQQKGILSSDSQGEKTDKKLVLITAHRRENFGVPLENICNAIRTLANHYGNTAHFIYPVHLNPNVQKPVKRILGNIPNVSLLPPMDYLPWVHLLKYATLVLTDSGGIQEEAPGLGVPVLVMREVTERPEGVEAGTVRLVGADQDRIVSESRRLLDDPDAHARMALAVNPYGDGHAAERIVKALLDYEK
ncbi:MAG: UDP-N-acetylglucosamine 2-epimerase (non-hydrolyzing) [Anaerolineales bacterium]|nr:UDP-N-acetylglucosamine 2-epimerase (non-hydrolyzing) [Anaerolineales bacterium]